MMENKIYTVYMTVRVNIETPDDMGLTSDEVQEIASGIEFPTLEIGNCKIELVVCEINNL